MGFDAIAHGPGCPPMTHLRIQWDGSWQTRSVAGMGMVMAMALGLAIVMGLGMALGLG